MTSLVSLERADLSLGTAHLLDAVSLGVADGARVGIVGRNGSGKSTLLRVMAGFQEVDSGRVTRPAGITVGLLGQADDLDPAVTVGEHLLGTAAVHELAGDARVRGILSGLLGGVDVPGVGGPRVPVGDLSGGERRRVALAALLAADPDLLLLDEPTNHLDIEAVAWLAEYLADTRNRNGSGLVAITHDRWFLDAVATMTWEVNDGRVYGYDGGYAAYVLAKAERARVATATAERRANLLRKELAWLRRGPPARTSKPRFRIEAATALIADEPPPRDTVSLARFASARLGKDVIDLLDVTVRLGDVTVLEGLTWQLAPGERVGVLGANGAGKSTLLRVLVGELPVSAGRRKVGSTVVCGYLSQEVTELDRLAGYRVVEAVADVRQFVRIGDRDVSASQLAQQLGFTGARQQAPVADLSGGERRRLQFIRLLMTEPNVLVLDEPTNDLDIETLTAIEDVLDRWPGTLVVVSHDRYLLERMCDRQVAMLGDGRVRDLPGGVDQYLDVRAHAGSARAATRSPEPAQGVGGSGGPSEVTSAQVRAARKDLARLERHLDRLAATEAGLHAQLAEHATDHDRVLGLDRRLQDLLAERESVEQAWLAVAELLEDAEGGDRQA